MSDAATLSIEPLSDATRADAHALLRHHWGDRVVSLGRVHDPFALLGLVAMEGGLVCGVITYAVDDDEMEVVTLASTGTHKGTGRVLMDAAFTQARGDGLARVWLITTNDNLRAIGFYQIIGMTIAAVRPGAITEARKTLKPEIPLTGLHGIAIRDEIEFEYIVKD